MCWSHSGALISCKQPCLPSQEPEGASEASRAGGGWVTSQPKLLFRQSRKEELLFEIFILLSFLNFKHCPKAWAGFVHTTHQKPMCSASMGPVHRQRRQNIGLRSRGWTEPCFNNTFNDNNLACSRNGELKWEQSPQILLISSPGTLFSSSKLRLWAGQPWGLFPPDTARSVLLLASSNSDPGGAHQERARICFKLVFISLMTISFEPSRYK